MDGTKTYAQQWAVDDDDTYVVMSEESHEYRHNNAGYRGHGVGNCHQRASEVRGDVDVVGQKATEHASDASDSYRHEGHRCGAVAAYVAQSQETTGWYHGC